MTISITKFIRIRQMISMFLISLLIAFGSPLTAFADDTVPTDTSTTTSTTTTATATATDTTAPTTTDPTAATTPTTTDPTATTTTTTPTTTDPTAPAPTTSTDPTTSPTTTDPTTATTGPQQPTGADSTTYTYNATTGLWENSMYTWDPVTKQTAPKQPQSYSYNPATGQWDTTEWVYDAPSGTYVPNTASVATPPQGAAITSPTSSSSASGGSPMALSALTSPTANTTNNPTSQPSPTPKNSGLFDLFYNASISNTLSSLAQTGDATVALNTLAGSALSGSATAIANVINLLQSSWNLLSGSFTTFSQNLFGNVLGDLTLNPGSINPTSATAPDNLTVNSNQNAAINNDMTLAATSGNATVTQNTQAGDATSGDATAIANLINAINSSISSGKSFIGMLNIFGNLNGDILIPPELTQTLLAANSVGTLDTSKIDNSSVLGSFNNNQTIANNVNLGASSGTATVSNNTSAGSATTGSAQTNLTVLNLTGRQIIGKDALLVFVNVLGKWVGMIVNAPTGSTSAALGGGITGDSTLSINSTGNQAITNNLNVNAKTGNALVDGNTSAGNATSGNAKAAVNLVNINSSQFALSDWFGILFINVFGTWNGSFGINTVAGTIPVIPTQSTVAAAAAAAEAPTVTAVRAFRFVPTETGNYTLEDTGAGGEVLAAVAKEVKQQAAIAPAHYDPPLIPKSQDWTMSILGVVLAGSLLGTERILTRRNRTSIH